MPEPTSWLSPFGSATFSTGVRLILVPSGTAASGTKTESMPSSLVMVVPEGGCGESEGWETVAAGAGDEVGGDDTLMLLLPWP